MAHRAPFVVAELGPDVDPFICICSRRLLRKGGRELRVTQGTPRSFAAASAAFVRELIIARKNAIASLKALADQHVANVLPVIREIRRAGATSLHQIADALNARGITTPRVARWYASFVRNLLARA